MSRLQVQIVAMLAVVWIIIIGVSALFHWKTLVKSQEERLQISHQLAILASQRFVDRIESMRKLTDNLAANPEYTTPDDLNRDWVRFDRLPRAQAARIALYDGITRWIPADYGHPVPIGSLPPSLTLWQLAHGLPLRAPKGRLLARSRRLLAEKTIGENPGVLDIGELDSVGRLVFLVPYTNQVRTDAVEIPKAILPQTVALGDTMGHPIVHKSLTVEGPDVVTFLAPIHRGNAIAYLMASFERSVRTRESEAGTAALFDAAHNLVLYSGTLDPSNRAKPSRDTTTVSVAAMPGFVTSLYYQQTDTRNAIFLSLIEISALSFIILTCLAVAATKLLWWIARLQWKLNHMQVHIEKHVQDLAHDFQNRILTLRTLTGDVTGRLTLDQLQRLSGAVTDLGGYTDQLSTDLVRDAFGSIHTFEITESPDNRVGTYLRGTLETIAVEQERGFGHPIPIVFDGDFAGQEPFVGISRAALTRIISNLLKNAIEACNLVSADKISLRVFQEGGATVVQVIDNGCGIPPEDRERIFDPGFSTKGDGRGKGLASSLDLAKSWSATITAGAPPSVSGSVLELRLVTRPTPSWFVNSIALSDKSVLVIVDDEGDVFEYWTKALTDRFEGITLPEERRPRLISLSSPAELRGNREGALDCGSLFLVDYRFKDEAVTGIDLIEELHLERKAILVTHFVDQPQVISAVERLDIRMLPKLYLLNAKFPISIGGMDD